MSRGRSLSMDGMSSDKWRVECERAIRLSALEQRYNEWEEEYGEMQKELNRRREENEELLKEYNMLKGGKDEGRMEVIRGKLNENNIWGMMIEQSGIFDELAEIETELEEIKSGMDDVNDVDDVYDVE